MLNEGKGSARTLLKVLSVARVPKLALGLALVLTLAEVAGTLAFPYLTSLLVDRVRLEDVTALQGPAGRYVAVVLASLIGAALMGAAARYVVGMIGVNLSARLKTAAFERLLRSPVHAFDDTPVGDAVSAVTTDVTLIAQLVSRNITSAFGGIVLLIGTVAVLLVLDAALTATMLGAIAVAFVVIVPVASAMAVVNKKTQERIGALSGVMISRLEQLPLIKIAVAEDREVASTGAVIDDVRRLGRRSIGLEVVLQPIVSLAVFVALLTVLVYGGMRVEAGAISVGTLTAFLVYLFTVVGPLTQLTAFVSTFSSACGASARVHAVLAAPSEDEYLSKPPAASPLPAPPSARAPLPSAGPARGAGDRGGFDIRGVTFRYPERTEVALRVPDLSLRGARSTAIIGPSGAGKSTLLALLARFHDPSAGTISYGGTDLRALPLDDWRRRIQLVTQAPIVMGGSVRDNVAYGTDGASDEAVEHALSATRCMDFVRALPDGMATTVGERGARLSGGQCQRIALARAFLADPEILLLDEVTSQLDEDNEREVLGSLDALMDGRTVVFVTHRTKVAHAMDDIIEARDGAFTVLTPTGRGLDVPAMIPAE